MIKNESRKREIFIPNKAKYSYEFVVKMTLLCLYTVLPTF